MQNKMAKSINGPVLTDAETTDAGKHEDGRKEFGGRQFLRDPIPWPEPVDGEILLDELTAAIRQYVVLEDGAAEAIALWIVHTHGLDAFVISPRLAITSAVMRCGKTTLLDILSCLVLRPLAVANVTAAGVFHAVDTTRPTLLVDEGDTFLPKDRALRGILNSGHHRHLAYVVRVDRTYSTWAAVAIAMIGELPATLADRSIAVRLNRRRADEAISAFRLDKTDELDRLARKVARWVADKMQRFGEADPEIPSALENRNADNWRPLLAIADTAGGEWPARARRIAEFITAASRDSVQPHEIMLLEDIHALFEHRAADRLSSAEMADALAELEGRPWGEGRGAMPISKKAIANLLAPFKIAPLEMRIGGHVLRGYRIGQFEDAFARYLPAVAQRALLAGPATPLQPRSAEQV